MSSSVWQQAWDNAQPQLQSIRESFRSTVALAPRVLRVGQLDAELLDQELVRLLQEPLNKALSQTNTSLRARFEPELALIIQLTLFRLSVWNIGASYGAKLQDLKYQAPSSKGAWLAPSGLPMRTLLMHGSLTVLIPYLHTRLRAHALSKAWSDAPSYDKRRKAWDALTAVDSTHTLFGLLNFIAFLVNGRYRTLADRLLKLRLVPSRRLVRRNVSYEFMNRQMVWHAFTEFLLFLLPLINVRALRRRLNRLTSFSLTSMLPASIAGANKGKGGSWTREQGKYHALPPDQCAICAENASYNLNPTDRLNAFTSLTASAQLDNPESLEEDQVPTYPITNPYVTSCSHTYCYVCLVDRMMRAADDGEVWECLRCRELVRSVDRVIVEQTEVEDEEKEEIDYYEFSSDMGDMSGSAGSYSYSESGLSDEA